MIVTRNSIDIDAPALRIYGFAAPTERWPQLLPHYRDVRILERSGNTRTVAMSAWRDAFPISWVAEQINDPARPHIFFRHTKGWTRGMEVEWLFEPIAGGTRVTIEHRLEFQFPFARAWIGRHIVSDFFVHAVANRTLARMKTLAEGTQ